VIIVSIALFFHQIALWPMLFTKVLSVVGVDNRIIIPIGVFIFTTSAVTVGCLSIFIAPDSVDTLVSLVLISVTSSSFTLYVSRCTLCFFFFVCREMKNKTEINISFHSAFKKRIWQD
jgi:hypothetical protein